MLKPSTYFRILPTCTRYENLDYSARHKFLRLDPIGRRGNVLLDTVHTRGPKTDLSFYENEVEQIMNLTSKPL